MPTRLASFALLALAGVCSQIAFAQSPVTGSVPDEPAVLTQDGLRDTRGQRPLTEAEQRDRELGKLDPFARQESKGNNSVGKGKPSVQKPLPGSVAESNQAAQTGARDQGPQVVAPDGTAAEVAPPAYSGPAVLSRSYTLTRPSTPQQTKFSWTVGSSEIWDNGLYGGSVVNHGAVMEGALNGTASFGTQLNWTARGQHLWKRDLLRFDYGGSYNNYTSIKGYNGVNQRISADYTHILSRHLTLSFVESAMSANQNYGLENQLMETTSTANVNLGVSPSTQLLNSGMRQFTSMTELKWRKSARLAFTFGGGAFGTEQTGVGFIGNSGYMGQADMSYRLTRKMTLGTYYSYTTYTFSHHAAVSSMNTVGGIYSYAFNRSTQVRVRAGITNVETLALQNVPIDPGIAVLLGQNSGVIDYYRMTQLSDVSAEFVRDLGRNRTANFSYTHGVAPGNGILLASSQSSMTGTFSALLFRKYRFEFAGGKSSLSALSQLTGRYDTNWISAGVSRAVSKGMMANFRVDYRQFDVIGGPMLHTQLRISTGFTWGPGEGKLW